MEKIQPSDRPETEHPNEMRLRTSVLPDDAHQWVYVPKVGAL